MSRPKPITLSEAHECLTPSIAETADLLMPVEEPAQAASA
jgi:hypothetical protein